MMCGNVKVLAYPFWIFKGKKNQAPLVIPQFWNNSKPDNSGADALSTKRRIY
jgi:hypothetical protein